MESITLLPETKNYWELCCDLTPVTSCRTCTKPAHFRWTDSTRKLYNVGRCIEHMIQFYSVDTTRPNVFEVIQKVLQDHPELVLEA